VSYLRCGLSVRLEGYGTTCGAPIPRERCPFDHRDCAYRVIDWSPPDPKSVVVPIVKTGDYINGLPVFGIIRPDGSVIGWTEIQRSKFL
jgi:hypothetical protein